MKKIILLFAVLFASLGVEAQSVEECDTIVVEETVYGNVEVQPEFPGGMAAMMKYMKTNISYPPKALEEKAQGKAFVRFIVEKSGAVSNAEILRSTGNIDLDKEALRVINNMPNWRPGMQLGEPVRAFYVLPVTFRL